CMTLCMVTKLHDFISEQDYGLTGKTVAVGLAVIRPSKLVGYILTTLLYSACTVVVDHLYLNLKTLEYQENIFIEPSATSGFHGVKNIIEINKDTENAIHLVWSTGGNMVPDKEQALYYQKAEEIIDKE